MCGLLGQPAPRGTLLRRISAASAAPVAQRLTAFGLGSQLIRAWTFQLSMMSDLSLQRFQSTSQPLRSERQVRPPFAQTIAYTLV